MRQEEGVLVLTTLLLLSRNDLRWAPYLAMLPSDVALPVGYTADGLEQLKGPKALLQLVANSG